MFQDIRGDIDTDQVTMFQDIRGGNVIFVVFLVYNSQHLNIFTIETHFSVETLWFGLVWLLLSGYRKATE